MSILRAFAPLPLLCGLLGATSALAAEVVAEFDFARSGNADGWTAQHDLVDPVVSRRGLELRIAGADPYLHGPLLKLPADQPLHLRIRLWSEFGGVGEVFLLDTAAAPSSVRFEVPAGRWTEALVPLPPVGPSPRLRLDPPGTGGRCLVQWLRIEASGTAGVTHVQATPDELALTVEALDDALEIVELLPHQTQASVMKRAPLARVPAHGSRRVTLPRFDQGCDRLYSSFAARTGSSKEGGRLVGAPHYVEELQGISRCADPFPRTDSKKGLQVKMVDDAIQLKVKHAALNVNLADLVDTKGEPDSLTWSMDGRTYHFHRRAVEGIAVKPLSDAGIQVTLILLSYMNGAPAVDVLMRHPRSVPNPPNGVVAFNVHSADGARQFRACAEFLADRFSAGRNEHGRVVGYIVGNELDSYNYWYNLGPVPMETVAAEYLKAVRIVHTAVRKSSAHARVYLSLDNCWGQSFDHNPLQTCAGRAFLDYFNRLAKLGGDFDWHLAYHPYPENIFDPRSWLDKTVLDQPDTPRITYKNLEQLPAYLRRPELLYRGSPRRIILSEQGFHSADTPEGQTWQAAGFCYAYRKAVLSEGIDAFIVHRHVDYRAESGLNFGLWTRRPDSLDSPAQKKRLYEVFLQADSPDWEKAFAFALPVIGIRKWDELAPPRSEAHR